MMKTKQDDFTIFQRKIAVHFFGNALLSVAVVISLYFFLWRERLGDWIVLFLEAAGKMDHEKAFSIYHSVFREYRDFFCGSHRYDLPDFTFTSVPMADKILSGNQYGDRQSFVRRQ